MVDWQLTFVPGGGLKGVDDDDDDSGSGRSAGSCASSLGFARPPTRFHFWFLLYIPPHGRPIWSLGGAPGVGVPIPNTP